MLDRCHPTNKYDVQIARIRRTTRITYVAVGAFVTLAGSVLAVLNPPG